MASTDGDGEAAVQFGWEERLLMAKISVDIFERSFSSFLWIWAVLRKGFPIDGKD